MPPPASTPRLPLGGSRGDRAATGQPTILPGPAPWQSNSGRGFDQRQIPGRRSCAECGLRPGPRKRGDSTLCGPCRLPYWGSSGPLRAGVPYRRRDRRCPSRPVPALPGYDSAPAPRALRLPRGCRFPPQPWLPQLRPPAPSAPQSRPGQCAGRSAEIAARVPSWLGTSPIAMRVMHSVSSSSANNSASAANSGHSSR